MRSNIKKNKNLKYSKELELIFTSSKSVNFQKNGKNNSLDTKIDFGDTSFRENSILKTHVSNNTSAKHKSNDKKESSFGVYRHTTKYIDYRKGFYRTNNSKSSDITKPNIQEEGIQPNKCSRFDYQPNICKDYKETGYCGYGDACKFLHDRSDYKYGWQIEDQTLDSGVCAQHKKRIQPLHRKLRDMEKIIRLNTKEMPTVCLMCKESWKESSHPVKTICGHFFHEKCAIVNNAKSGRCFFCGELTKGIFNTAVEIVSHIKKKEISY